MASQNKRKKFFLKNASVTSVIDDILYTIYYYNSKGKYITYYCYYKIEDLYDFWKKNIMIFGEKMENLR